MKKFVSIILSILLVMLSCFSPAFAGEEAEELVINELGSATLSNTSLDTAVTLDGSPTAKWLTKGTGGWPSVTINADLSAYDYLNVQLYSPKATDDTIGISFRTTVNFTASPTLIDWEGWKTLQIPLSAYAGLKEAGVITYFDLWDQGWNYTYGDAIAGSDKNGSLNIGRIWLSKEAADDGGYVLKESDEVVRSCVADEENKYNGNSTVKWNTTGSGSQVTIDVTDDITAFNTVNLEIYSPKVTDDTIGIHFYASEPKDYATKVIKVDWEGWKLLQISFSEFSPSYSSSINLATVYSFQLWDHGWGYNFGNAVSGSDMAGSLNLGKIWLSNEEVALEDEIVIADGSLPFRGGTCEVDNTQTIDGKSTVKWNTTGNESQVVYNVGKNLSAVSVLNMEIYSPKATDDTIGVHFKSPSNQTYSLKIDWSGWKKVQIPLSAWSSLNASAVTNFELWDYGWNYTYGDTHANSDKNGSLNIGKIWLDNSEIETPDEPDTPPSEPDEPVVPDEPEDDETAGEYTIAKYDSGYAFGGKLSKDTQNVYEQDASAKWDVRAGNNFGYNVLDCNFNDYAYVYATVYSPKATGSIIMFQYLFDGTGYAVSNIPLNFEGWKTLAFPISEIGIGTNKVKAFNIYNNGWTNKIEGIEYVNFERIWLSKYDISKCEIIEESLVDGYNRVSPVDFEAFVKTTSKLDAEVAPEVILKSESGKTVETSYEIKGSKLTLKATETLDYGESYTLTVNNITDKNGNSCSYSADFSTHSKAITALTPELKEAGGKITAVSTATNPTSGANDALIWICEYSKDGGLVNSVCETVSVESGKDAELKAELTMKSSENKVEAFVTDSTGRPVVPFVAVYGKEHYAITPSVGGTNELTIDSESVSCYGVEADVSLKSKFESPVVAYVKSSDGKVVYAKAAMTDADGKASFDALLSADALTSGKYTFSVYAENSANNPGFEFYFADSGERSSVFGSVSKATTVSAIESAISENCKAFNYSAEFMQTGKTAKFLAEVINANKTADFEALCEIMDKALSLRTEINTCDWNKLPEIIEENYNLLLCSGLKADFSRLSSDQKSKVAKKLKENTPYELFSDFKDDLDGFIDDVKSGSAGGSSAGGGGGGGKGGSSYSVPVAGGVSSNPAINPNLPFDDLGSASWAQDSIIKLYNEGVISPSADRKFRPDDTVTREEFTKLVCAAFNLEDSSALCSFSDVSADAWYYMYIASMSSKGIITGYGETFGTGNTITREDMAVISLRSLEYLGMGLDSGVYASFADEADVSSYAVDAVYALKNAGIINGMGNGSFVPKSNATRAQAAKIICGLMELAVKEAVHNG